MHVSAIDHLVINVADVERSLTWYTEMLGLGTERVDEWRSGDVPFPSVRINATSIIDLMEIERTGRNVDHFCLVGVVLGQEVYIPGGSSRGPMPHGQHQATLEDKAIRQVGLAQASVKRTPLAASESICGVGIFESGLLQPGSP